MLCTLGELKAHLRIEHTHEEPYLEMLLKIAQATTEDFCKTTFSDAPEPVRLAILLHASHFYTNRESTNPDAFRCMLQAFHSLLWPYRDTQKIV